MAVKFQRRSDNSIGTLPENIVISRRIAAAGDAVDQNVWICQGDYELVGVKEVHGTASTSGTLQVEKCTGTTAPGSGTALLSSTISLAGAANTVLSGTLIGTQSSLRFTTGDRLTFDFGGTVTNFVNGIVTVYLKRIQGANSAY